MIRVLTLLGLRRPPDSRNFTDLPWYLQAVGWTTGLAVAAGVGKLLSLL